jgi:hypothetical protein
MPKNASNFDNLTFERIEGILSLQTSGPAELRRPPVRLPAMEIRPLRRRELLLRRAASYLLQGRTVCRRPVRSFLRCNPSVY